MNVARYREKVLIELNSRRLAEAAAVVRKMDEREYQGRRAHRFARIAGMYEAFFEGIANGRIDYETRVKTIPDRSFTVRRLLVLSARMALSTSLLADAVVWVRVQGEGGYAMSSVARELQGLLTGGSY